VINSGSGSGIPGWRRKFPLLSREKSLETVCYDLCIFKLALKWTRSVRLRAYFENKESKHTVENFASKRSRIRPAVAGPDSAAGACIDHLLSKIKILGNL
jgi:hypothetical protein